MYDIVCMIKCSFFRILYIKYILIKRISFKRNMTHYVKPISIKYCLIIKVYYQIRQNNALFTTQTDKSKDK